MSHASIIDAINGANSVDAIMSTKTKRAAKTTTTKRASKKVVEIVDEKPSFDFYTKPDGSPVKLRPNTKRKMICDAWFVNNKITLDEVAQISHWSRAVNSSELYQIAVIFGRKIQRVGEHYSFIID